MDRALTPPLFAQVLGPAFAQLPPVLRELHTPSSQSRYVGQAVVQRGRHPLLPLCAWLVRLPRTGPATPVEVVFRADARGERWERRFGTHAMPSRLWLHRGRLRERLGAVVFEFALRVDGAGIEWRAARAWAFGVLPLPRRWLAGVHCREDQRDGRYAFVIAVTLPWIGPFIRYEGWLAPA
ncbi:DUF4166 domain-containing protein [Xanthomonas sp. A2111]|uniref:DUF4166 domain-containing protein n=1 Tax=Xanthomonas hawaiiensis TaxID=3003247 RepID=A0ABU2I809_9XANT|nr:DUF4166 domain-containing protein [Xanthomonas sp. A2111]MBO9827629.1 DUF4166 domain-containing protein [Xanthomonas sp. A2111]MDS9994281.1 DUF4166 domain-containing protein [Xanthomonas sp. A2111]